MDPFKVTTMTLVVRFQADSLLTVEGKPAYIDKLRLFPIIDIARLPELRAIHHGSGRYRIPYPGYGGAILSAQLGNVVRGVVRGGPENAFRNAITMDVSTASKNVNVKLSNRGIHICGADSVEAGQEAAQATLDAILQAQSELDYIRRNRDIARKTFAWVREVTRGPIRLVFADTNVIVPPDFVPSEGVVVQEINSVVIPVHYEKGYPPDVDAHVARFALRQAPDFWDHAAYSAQLAWIETLERVVSPGLGIERVRKSMVNHNYSLGFPVDRRRLNMLIHGREGFSSTYRNIVDYCVTITLPFDIPDELADEIVRKKRSVHFIVYKSGRVTQSGPCENINKKSYHKFMRVINELRPEIQA